MTTVLTETGWEDEFGNPLGEWTDNDDEVDEGDEIRVGSEEGEEEVVANTLGGDDIITGTSNFTVDDILPPPPPSGIQLIENSGITTFGNATINTENGNDNITGTGVGFGLASRGTIDTENGNDNITGTGECVGIFNSALDDLGIINTGNGDDNIIGTSISGIHDGSNEDNFFGAGIVNFGMIDTEDGNDNITGIINESEDGSLTRDDCMPLNFNSALVNAEGGTINTGDGNDNIFGTDGKSEGVENRSTIETGNGNDNIFGSGDIAGITNLVAINTGDGDDSIIGTNITGPEDDIAGINNTGMINTGNGNDTVDALTGGFASFGLIPEPEGNERIGKIKLGKGDDLIRGFGEQKVFGGRGSDTAELGIDFDQIDDLRNPIGSLIVITVDNATMAFTNVELFDFYGQEFTLEELQQLA